MKEALFFDVDGTLWDARKELWKSYQDTLKRLGRKERLTFAQVSSVMGLTPEESGPVLFPEASFSEGLSLFQECVEDEIPYLSKHPGMLYPKVKETLSVLQKEYPLYIVSNSEKGYVENFLSATGLTPFFLGHLCAGDTGKDKGENILLLQKEAGASKVLYIGDTRKDLEASRKAKALFLHARYGFGSFEPDPDYVLSFGEIPAKAKTLFERVKNE